MSHQPDTADAPGWPHAETDRSHVPAPPETIGTGTGLVYCKACGFLLWSDRGPSKGPRAARPCVPVPVRFRTGPDGDQCGFVRDDAPPGQGSQCIRSPHTDRQGPHHYPVEQVVLPGDLG